MFLRRRPAVFCMGIIRGRPCGLPLHEMNALTGGDGHAAVHVRTAGLRAIKVDVESIAVGTDHGGLAGFDENRFHGAVNNASIRAAGAGGSNQAMDRFAFGHGFKHARGNTRHEADFSDVEETVHDGGDEVFGGEGL